MQDSQSKDAPIETRLGPITAERVEAFRQAVAARSEAGMPLTFSTLYRYGEFEWVNRLGTGLQNLLHTEQQYEYLSPLPVGSDPVIRTSLVSCKSKAGMTFITLESEVIVGGVVCVKSQTNFVVREAVKK